MFEYHFTDEYDGEILKAVKSKSKLSGNEIDRIIGELEGIYGCMVLWERIK
jgi:hypothetical protein